MKRIVLCADDYGQAPAISDGILDLIAKKRLTATSCLVNMPYWPQYAKRLLPFQQDIDIGLHFNLTQGEPLSPEFKRIYGQVFPKLPNLIRKAYVFTLDQKIIAAELNAQIDAFQQEMGFLPKFIDGHQHIHHLPIIRKAVLDVYNDRLRESHTYVRLVDMHLRPSDFFDKKMVIYATGVRRFRQLLNMHNIPHNDSFSGIYRFKDANRYPAYFRRFLQEIEDGGLIMCHPGLESDGASDDIGKVRPVEYKYLISDQFERDLIEQNVVLGRFQ